MKATPEMIAAGVAAARKYMEETGGNNPAVIWDAMWSAQPREPEQEPVPALYVKDINGNFHPYKEKGHTVSSQCVPPSLVRVGKDDSTPQPKEPEQEPVAQWLEDAFREGWAACRDAEFVGEDGEDWQFGNSTANSRMIDLQQSTPPPVTESHKRTWFGLTLEDKKEYAAQDFGGNRLDAMDWTEKRLKEKNT